MQFFMYVHQGVDFLWNMLYLLRTISDDEIKLFAGVLIIISFAVQIVI
jgi:hypothetical protein